MTIKHFNKNISAENKNILTNAILSNGILTFTVENLIEDGANRIQSPISIDLSEHKLKLKIISSARLTELASSQSAADIRERESYIFLVPFPADEEGTYREYIWIVENEGQQNESGKFEVIGSTRVDLTNYIQKSNSTNLLLANGTNIAQSTFAKATDLTSKENISNKVKSTSGWSSTTTDDHYPSEKLVKSSLDNKVDKSNIANNLTTTTSDKVLDARQGKALADSKQDKLVSGTNIKTINNESLLGNGNVDTPSQNVFYGTCSTSASTQTKVVSVDDWSFTIGNILFVKFLYANDYNGTAIISIDGVTKDIAVIGTITGSKYYWRNGELVGFVYDGTNMIMLEQGTATTTYYGVTKLSDSISSTATNLSATANAVKTAYDLANSREDPSNKVTAMSSSSTDDQYPSAKAVYDALPKTTKTLTVTYTNGTTEDIEFYVK